jgi:predicted regulator of Ras-like GTPase activity (Roadblock/LC7/MglB family)
MLNSALKRFLSFPGVNTVLVIRSDGQIIQGVESDAAGQDQLAAVISFVMAESQALAAKLSQARVLTVFVEFRNMMLASIPIKDDLYLVMITAPDANTGQIAYELKKSMPEIRSYL